MTFQNIRVRNLLLTWFKFPATWVEELKELPFLTYLCGQVELCPTTGSEHVQAYMEFSKAVYISKVRMDLPQSHLEARRGSQKQAIDYCQKEETFCRGRMTHGTPKAQGARTELAKVASCIEEGMSLRDIYLECPNEYMRYSKGIERGYALFNGVTPRNAPPTVYWCTTKII